jgi:tricarballylate dehydrogenase
MPQGETMTHPDVLVIGAGLAGLSAALTAREQGASVMVIERAPIEERGGNSRFAIGAMRSVYAGVDELQTFAGAIGADERARVDFGAYSREQYLADLARVTQQRSDAELAQLLVDGSADTMRWLRGNGVRFTPLYQWQFKQPDGHIKFAGGSAVGVAGAGAGLADALFKAAERSGVTIAYGTRAVSLLEGEHGMTGVRARQASAGGGRSVDLSASAVVLASGGFEANAEWRTRYLGPGWELAKVRGSRFNTGDGLRMALEVGAMPCGNWSGCHSASWDLGAPDVNELRLGATFKRDDFLFGVMVNARGERFVDEGADIRALTYARMGRAILAQPGQVAWQIYDRKVAHLLHDEYRAPSATRYRGETLAELAGKLDGIDRAALQATIAEFNRAVRQDVPFDPGKKDGRSTTNLAVPKSNWASTIDEPPFEAFPVTCGITFTFGGVRTDRDARVLDVDGAAIPGLYAAGELVGGLFYFNYPGGSGLMAAAVFGRIAGRAAAQQARSGSAPVRSAAR